MANKRDIETEENSEQIEPDQAQSVADDALSPEDGPGALESTKPHGGITDDDSDVHDIVDMMKQMITSGRVDMGAYAGEPLMDDGDGEMPGTPAGPMTDIDDDVMGGAHDPIDEAEDTGEDPLASMVGDSDGDEETGDV